MNLLDLTKKIKPIYIVIGFLIMCIMYMIFFECCYKLINSKRNNNNTGIYTQCECPTFTDMVNSLKGVDKTEPKETFNPKNKDNLNGDGPEDPTYTGNYDANIVLYYASWCGFSRMFLPEWEKFETYAKNNLKNVRVKKIICEDENEKMCHEKGVKGYPTIILYQKSGNEVMFEGERKSEELIKFIKTHTQ